MSKGQLPRFHHAPLHHGDESLALFERGVSLSRYCHDQLGAAERRIEQLTERGELRDGSHLAEPSDADR